MLEDETQPRDRWVLVEMTELLNERLRGGDGELVEVEFAKGGEVMTGGTGTEEEAGNRRVVL